MVENSSFESEIDKIRLDIVRFLNSLFLVVTLGTITTYLVIIVSDPERNTSSRIFFFILSIVIALVHILLRRVLNERNYRLIFWVQISIPTTIAIFFCLSFGTYGALQVPLLIVGLLTILIVIGPKQAGAFMGVVILTFAAISHLHSRNIVKITPYSTTSDFANTAILLLLMWVIFRIGKIGYSQIERSYAEALSYSRRLEELNKSLDLKVKERTKLLQDNYAREIESMYNSAIIGSITKPLLHDIATPISALLGTINLMRSTKHHDEELLDLASTATERISNIITESRELIRGKSVIEVFDAKDHIDKAVKILRNELDRNDIHLELKSDKHYKISGPLSLFERIIINILVNAIEELKQKDQAQSRRILIDLKEKDDTLSVIIEDNGRGIDPKHLHQIFDPEFSLKYDYFNLGLGLPFVKQTLEERFYGKIEIESALKEYTRVRLNFNLYKKAASE